jgi:hypothetical protein
LKFVFGLLLLVYVYAFSAVFLSQFAELDYAFKSYFWYGISAFVVCSFFVFEPMIIYKKGQKIVEVVFKFFAPLVKVAPFLLPVYSILLFFVYLITAVFVKNEELPGFFLFFFGFTLGMHLVFGAKSLKTKKEDFLKGNYIFGFSLIFVINVWLSALIISLVFSGFSFVTFSYEAIHAAGKIYNAIFTQLFVT